jgi:hypothetical protein
MKAILFTSVFFFISSNFFSQDTISNFKQLDSLIKKIEKDILDLKSDQKNLISEKDCSDLKKKEKDSFDLWKKVVPELRSKISELNGQTIVLKLQVNKNKTSIDSLKSIINSKTIENKDLADEKIQLTQNKISAEKHLSEVLNFLRKSNHIDTNLFNLYKNLNFAANYNSFTAEVKAFSLNQNKLSKIELKLNNREFKEFKDLANELNLITLESKYEGLSNRKETIIEDINNLKSLFKDITLKINEINAKGLPQWKFNSEFFIPLETFKLSDKELFVKYPFVQFQIDQVLKNQKHVLPVIN